MVYLFGEWFRTELVFAILTGVAVCLVFLRLQVILFLALVSLILPNLDTPFARDARLLRWAFLAALLIKGVMDSGLGVFPKPPTGAHRFLVFLVMMILASIGWSIGSSITLAQGGMMIVLLGGIFAVLWNSWGDPRDIVSVCSVFFVFAACLFGFQALYMLANPQVILEGVRVSGAFLNPNGAGSAVAFLAPFVYWKYKSSRQGLMRIMVLGLAAFMAFNLMVSGARSALLGAVICLGVVLTYVHGARVIFLALLVGLPVVGIFVAGESYDQETVDVYWRPDTIENLSDRLPMWERGWGLLMEKPVLGYGFAMNRFATYGRADYELSNVLDHLHGANYHNAHLQLALDIGIVGLLIFWGFLYYTVRAGYRLFRSPRRTSLELAGIVFFATFVTLLGDSLVHGWLFSPGSSMSIVFWVSAAAVLRVQMHSEQARLEEQASAGAEELPELVLAPALK